jgi:AcrR family transcriptional regulator
MAWRGEPLPRGRHKLPASTVRESQRARIVRAMLECVGREGYEATTVPEVVATARVSRNAFYEFFDDKADCFIAVCDETSQELLGELLELVSEPSWIEAMHEGAYRYLLWWQERPTISSAYLLSLPTVGERALRQRERHYAAFRAVFQDLGRRARAEQPELEPLSDLVPRVLVLAITELVAEEVRAGRTSKLAELAGEVAVLAIGLLADDATAARARDRPPKLDHMAAPRNQTGGSRL